MLVGVCCGAAAPPASPPSPGTQADSSTGLPLTPEQVLGHLKRTIDWYQSVEGVAQQPPFSADETAPDALRRSALTCLRLAFDFAHAAAAVLAPTPSTQGGGADANDPQRGLTQAAARVGARVTDLQIQLSMLDAQIERASAGTRSNLTALRGQVSAQLALEREVQSTVSQLLQFQTSTLSQSGAGGGLGGQIADLERAVPEVRRAERTGTPSSAAADASKSTPSTTTATSAARAAPTISFRPDSAGLFALTGEWFSLQSAVRELDGILKQTDDLSHSLDTLRPPLTAQARDLVKTGLTDANTADPAALAASRQALQEASAHFKQLSTLLVPLGEQDLVVDGAHGTLVEWRNALRARARAVARYALLHAAVLAASVAAVLIVSDIWRRATFRYLSDTRRRRTFLTLRRIVVSMALVLIVIFGLISEVGSLATYIGFLTAGLAVALQNVILAVAAYFFFIGRYGVRVGDRITLAGVTGRVIEIGLIRIYLMELGSTDLRSTGRIVVLSNAVLFQPQALFKQIPGADYMWHTVSLMLAPTVDLQQAEQRLQAAADAVYGRFRAGIDQQHAAMQRQLEFDSAPPRPDVRVRFEGNGFLAEVRYPVQAEQAALVDQQMIQALRAALALAPPLATAESGEPTLKRPEAMH
jgi:small-conductance mechanosensitive channel